MNNLKVHQIWLNAEPPPQKAREFMHSWDAHDVTVHGGDQIATIRNQAAVREIYKRYPVLRDCYRALSDLLRYQIMYDEGGLYVDIDMELVDREWLPPEGAAVFRPHNQPRRFKIWDRVVCNGILWFPEPGHPLMGRCLMDVDLERGNVKPHGFAGPMRLRENWQEHKDIERIDFPQVAFWYNRQTESSIVSWSRWWKTDRVGMTTEDARIGRPDG